MTPTAVVTVTNFTVVPEISGTGRIYRTSFTMNETGGRSAAVVNTIRFSTGIGTADANPSPPIRIAAGASASSRTININDSAGTTVGITSISVAVGYADDSGRSTSTSGTATFTQPSSPPAATTPAPAPTVRTFTLAGVVTDLSGRAVRGATVTATDSTNAARTASSDGNGYFSIAPLREGSVRLQVAATGFVTSTRTVSLSSDLRLDTALVDVAPAPSAFRVGARCKDGTTSTATGSGACSSHDGVSCWIYSDGSCRAS